MNVNVQIGAIFKQVGKLLRRFHIVIFAVTVLGGLAVAVLILSSILQASSDTTAGSPAAGIDTTFDTGTIEKIENLHTRQDGVAELELPSGRINPFGE